MKTKTATSAAATYSVGDKVIFGKYGKETKKADQVFTAGETLEVIEIPDDATEILLGRPGADPEVQGWAFPAEISGLADTSETPAKAGAKKIVAKGKGGAVSESTTADGITVVAEDGPVTGKAVSKKAEKAEAKAAEPVLKHAPSVAKLIADGVKGTLKAALELVESISTRFYQLGGVLYEIKRNNYHETVRGEDGELLKGQPGFAAYIASILNVEYRMAQHYINVYAVTRAAGIPESKIAGLKFTKVLHLIPLIEGKVIDTENWDEWATKVKNLKGDAFKDEVSTAMKNANIERGASRGATANQARFMFVLFDDRAKVVRKALEMAIKELPPLEDGAEHSNSEAFDHIVSEWLAYKKNEKSAAKSQSKAA